MTPGEQVAGARADASADATATNRKEIGDRLATNEANKKGEQLYSAIAKSTAYAALTPRAKSFVHTALVGYGMDVPAAIAAVQRSNNPDKAAIVSALGGR